MRWAILLLALAGCDDHLFLAPHGDAPTATGFCGVQQILAARCTSCHNPDSGPIGELDLATDAHAALVGEESALYPGKTLVVPGDPAASLVYLKITGAQGNDGGPMPPTSGLDEASATIVADWIRDGAPSHCDETIPTVGGGYHPDGWADPAEHGLAAKLQEDVCVDCHGADLSGDIAPSCDGCHAEGWRTDCTFCHGGEHDATGAPPRDIDGSTTAISFPEHTAHVQADLTVPLDCSACHRKPTDVLSAGHLFIGDATPAVADVDFSGGLGAGASWSRPTCSDVYCHGDGRRDGDVDLGDGPLGCAGCHPSLETDGRWDDMSGAHDDHLDEGVRCHECHGDTTTDSTSIASPGLHVNGRPDLRLSGTVVRSGGTCTGSCHGESHGGREWVD